MTPGPDPEVDDAAGDRLRRLGEFIRDERRRSGTSMRQLADRSGVSNPYLSQIERGLRRPSADILRRLADALALSPEALYVRAGILPDRRETDVIGEILRDHVLDAEQRRALVRVYRAMRAEAGAPILDLTEGPPGKEPVDPESADPESSGQERR